MLVCGVALAGPKILVFGDSLSSAYGIRQARGWVSLLEVRLKRDQFDYSVVNASISGEITSGGALRLPKLLNEHDPAVVIVELGSNDGLRGLPIAQMRANIAKMVELSQKKGASVLLVGMRMPPNYGPDYTRAFETMYSELAARYKTALLPFLFEGIADIPDMFLADRLHPSETAQPRLLENVWTKLHPLLRKP